MIMWSYVFRAIDEMFDEMVKIRRYLHQYPELSFQETNTAKFIREHYQKIGLPFKSNIGGNGVIATLKGAQPGKTVALRADFDALPIQEENDVPYKSLNPGVMHACGHDGHTAALLGLAKAVLPFKEKLPGTIVFLHQPAEEYAPGGAKPMIEAGALEGVDAVFGTHLWPDAPFGVVQTRKGALMAAADRFEIIIKGKGGHGAKPHQTKDAILIGSQIVTALQQIVSRRLDPLKSAVVTIGTFEAGQAFNIIADSAKITGTARSFEKEIQQLIIDEMEKIIRGICTAHDVHYEFHYYKGYPPVVNHHEEADMILQVGKLVPGVTKTEEIEPTMTGEDFAYYLMEKPGAFFFTGAQKEGHYYPLHSPMFDFDERAMLIAAKMLFQAYIRFQEKYTKEN
jgi:amidohydrolase